MLEGIISNVADIFVGRHTELNHLESLLKIACQDREHLVYVFLNAPGVGKTTLIDHFGKSIEADEKGLFIKFICISDYDSPFSLNKSIIKTIDKKINQNYNLIEKYITQNLKKENRERFRQKLKSLQDLIKKVYPVDKSY